MSFSVLISVYHKESPLFLREALDSVLGQTLPPGEIVLVEDGPLPQSLEEVIDEYAGCYPQLFKIIPLKENRGLGPALTEGIKHCSFDLIARMDSDDIARKNRFLLQMEYMERHPEVTALGGQLMEFRDTPGDLYQLRRSPLKPGDVLRFSRKRNPMNHPSVVFRKKDILSVGAYDPIRYFEDYHLWLKLLRAGFHLANLEETLLYFRVGNDMIGRRSGYAYARDELAFFHKAYRGKLIGKGDYLKAVLTRFPLRLAPKGILNFIYQRKLR